MPLLGNYGEVFGKLMYNDAIIGEGRMQIPRR